MALPELLANTPTPGTRAAIATITEELKNEAGALTLNLSQAMPVPLQGPGQTRLTINSEIMLVEATSSTTVTILTRAVEESTKAAHLVGASVYALPTLEGLRLAGLIPAVTKLIAKTEKWKKPAYVHTVTIVVIGGGGGGGGGAHGVAKTICTGGGGGGGGAMAIWTFPASALTASEYEVTVGKGGVGGKGFETEKAGQIGTEGETSNFGELLYASGGNPGKGGAITGVASTGGGEQTGMFAGNPGVGCASTGNPAAQKFVLAGGGGGGGGAGITVAEKAETGGEGGGPIQSKNTGATHGAEGAAGLAGSGIPGKGGGGGSAVNLGPGEKGGAGGKYGGGGGGGGCTFTAAKFSGEGGAGGEGAVIIIAY